MNKKELFEEFRSITGCRNKKEAEQYLEACSFDLATAVDLYFARDTTGSGSNGTSVTTQEGDVLMASDGEDDDVQCIQGTSSNTRITRSSRTKSVTNGQLQKTTNSSHSRAMPVVEPEVRAPIPSTRGPIVFQSFNQQYGGVRRRGAAGSSIFNQEVRDFRQEAVDQERLMRRAQNGIVTIGDEPEVPQAQGSDRNGVKAPNSLQSLFRPPLEIMFNGTWEMAKAMATRAEKWLLVNIQNAQEFACQTLNRDVWANSGVKELVKTNFIFWQIQYDSSDGERLRNYYRITAFPAIFIVDPRTGELMNTILLKRQDPVTFCDSLATFLDQCPDLAALDRKLTGGPSRPEPDAFGPGIVTDVAAEPECSRSLTSAMEEDGDSSVSVGRKRKLNGTDSAYNVKRGKTNGKDVDVEDLLNENTRSLSVVDKDDWKKEISKTGSMCRIRLKFPDGKQDTVEITDESKLKALFLFITGLGLSAHDHHFVLSFPRREYSIDHAEKTLKALEFTRNEMVHVELK